ncbi:MAG: TetR/AcrR family transcriptional regulator, partial [Desulfobulbaceae bacterium]|nr:TetR/AcrR family transcriptional regulator [Desulfobulbaceae bacterium]
MIVQAAVKEFASKGYQKASVNAIARELGIAKGSLYQYFANKEALFLHVFETFTTLVRESVKKRVSSAGGRDFFILTRKVLMAGIDFIDRHPEYFQLYLRVLFELDVPRREELVAKVRLFSGEYFGPICEQAQKGG